MPSASRPTVHHIALTVTDLDAAIEWYENVFDIRRQMEAPHDGGVGILLADDDWSLIIVLHRHAANTGEPFVETKTGLDHVGFAVADRAALEAWQTRLDEIGGVRRADAADRPLTQSPIADTPAGLILVFRDPDNIQLELYAPPGS